MYQYNQQQPQQTYGYNNNQGQQQGGYVNNWSTQPQQQQPQQQSQFNQLQSQPTGFGFGTQVQNQPTGAPSFGQQQSYQQQTQPLASQTTGWNQGPPMTSFQAQATGGQGLNPQRTGYQQQGYQQQQPLTSQTTGWNQGPPATSFQAQATGYQQASQQQQQPLASQTTGWNQGPPITSFQAQATGFQQQVPQATGWNQPPTTFGSMPLQSQATGFNQQQPLTAQPTGFISTLADMGTQKNDLELPNIRLSFISARDQERFENIFRHHVPKGENAMDGNTARTILMKSNLSAVQLSNIWELADTNKSGSLMFPEFCVALHLANMAKRGQSVPYELPTKIKNEVTGFVDTINFNIGAHNDYSANNPIRSQATGYNNSQAPLNAQRTGLVPLTAQQTSSFIPVQQTGMLNAQPTGIFSQRTGGGLIAQATGTAPPMTSFTAQQTGGFMPQQTGGFTNQQTGGFNNQQTGGFMPQQTGGFIDQQTGGLMPQQTGLQPMPTGRPGQWGFVSTPTGGLPGMDMMQSHFMPNAQSQSSLLQNQMGGSSASNVTWAITKQEKVIYDNIFKQWDKERHGFVSGDIAIGVFTKSGLSFSDLESIWTLCDQGNKGKLNKDEFAVAMHLIYRRLNGYDIPTYLPPELVPPSSKVLENTVDSMKDQLRKQASNGGVGSAANVKQGVTKSGTVYKNNDNSISYVSNSRHRRKNESPSQSNAFSTKLSVDDLKKQIHEKKILLAAIDAEDDDTSSNAIQQKSLNEIEMLKTKIKSLQSTLNSSDYSDIDSVEQKTKLSSQLNKFSDKVPQLVEAISQMDDKIKAAKIEIYRLKLQKENPSGIEIKGAGPNGEITEADRRIAKQKALLQAKMAKLTGKPAPNFDAFEDNEAKLSKEIISVTQETEAQKSIVQDIAESIKSLISEVTDSLNLTNSMSVGYSKWEKKQGVQSKEVSDFIDYLNSTKPAHKTTISQPTSLSNPYLQGQKEVQKEVQKVSPNAQAPQKEEVVPTNVSTTPSPGLSAAEERAKRIKEKAEKRMNERLAKLGISRKTSSNTSSNTSPKVESPKIAEPKVEEVPVAKPVAPVAEPVKQAPPPTTPRSRSNNVSPPPPPASSNKPTNFDTESDTDADDEEDDEEYKALLKQKQELEKREQERKNRKQREKEEKLAKLKAEMAALKKQAEESDDEWDDKESISKVATTEKDLSAHSNNPFASMANSASNTTVQPVPVAKASEEPKVVNNNPFSKPSTEKTSSTDLNKIDHEKLKAQRESQMGISKDDGWSDSEKEDSDDDMPTANKQAELASMLFGGNAQPSRSSTYIPPIPTTQTPESIPSVDSSYNEVEKVVEKELFPPPVPPSEPESIPSSMPPPIPQSFPPNIQESASNVLDEQTKINAPESSEMTSSRDASEFYDAKSEESSFIDPTPPSSPEVATTDAPSIQSSEIPPIPTSLPPPPIPDMAPPSTLPPPPPPVPEMAPPTISPPPPPPAMAPAPLQSNPTGGPPNIGALLEQITGGKSLRKVDESEMHIADGAVVGRVL